MQVRDRSNRAIAARRKVCSAHEDELKRDRGDPESNGLDLIITAKIRLVRCSLIRHLEHRNRGARANTARTYDRKPASPLHSTQRAHHAAATRAPPSTPRAPVNVRVATHTPPQQQPRPQSSTAREHATLHAAHTARARIAPPPEAAPPKSKAPDTTHERRRTTTKRCCVPTRALSRRRRSMGQAENLVAAPGNGAPLRARATSLFLPCERGLNSHTDVATRPHLSLAL